MWEEPCLFHSFKNYKSYVKISNKKCVGGFWLVLVWFAENIWITAVVTSPFCQTSSDIGELFLNGLLWVVSVRVLKARSFLNLFFSSEKKKKKKQRMLGEKEMLVKKDIMLQFPSGLFRSDLELFSVWDLRKFAFSSQAFSDMKVMSSLNQMNEGSFKIWQFIKAWCQSKGTAGGDRDRAETYWQMELSVTQIMATCVSVLSSHFKQMHLILDGSRMTNSLHSLL